MERAIRHAETSSAVSSLDAYFQNQSKPLKLTEPRPPQLQTELRARPPNFRCTRKHLPFIGKKKSQESQYLILSTSIQRPLKHEVDDHRNEIATGDGVSLGGDKDWARAVSELAHKVHAFSGEFEAIVTGVIEELARPCSERTANSMQWMHCLAVTGLLLESIDSLKRLQGKAIEPHELLHSLLLPAISGKTFLC